MNSEHDKIIRDFLDRQGLTFGPLRAEIMDHLIMDLNARLVNGQKFEDAWLSITSDLPEKHFKNIENQTMESINKKLNLSKVFTSLAIALLVATSAFKLMHLPGTTLLLFLSIIAIGFSFISGTVSGIYHHRNKKGSLLLTLTIIGILTFLLAWTFLTLQLPGAFWIRLIAVVMLAILFPILTIYFTRENPEDNILTYLHVKHTPGIERFLIILLTLTIILKSASVFFEYPAQVSWVFMVLIICAAGLQFFAYTWHQNTTNSFGPETWKTGLLIGLFLFYLLPALGSMLNTVTRSLMAGGFYLIAGIIAVTRAGSSKYTPATYAIQFVISGFYLVWMLIHLQILPESANSVLFNPLTLVLLLVALILTKKHSMLRMYSIMVVAHFMFEYPVG